MELYVCLPSSCIGDSLQGLLMTGEPSMPACLPVWSLCCVMSTCLSVFLSVCLPVSLSACLYVSVCLSTCLSVCMSCLLACLSICLPFCLPVCLLACLAGCLSAHHAVCLSACLPACLPACLCLSALDSLSLRRHKTIFVFCFGNAQQSVLINSRRQKWDFNQRPLLHYLLHHEFVDIKHTGLLLRCETKIRGTTYLLSKCRRINLHPEGLRSWLTRIPQSFDMVTRLLERWRLARLRQTTKTHTSEPVRAQLEAAP
jgi:hypothetical protein